MRRSPRWWLAAVVVAAVLPLTVSSAPGIAVASARASCHAPRLTGLTVTSARTRAKAAGCQLRLTGSRVTMPTIQTIHTQSVRPGHVAKVVTVLVNPLCPSAGFLGPPSGEPIIKSGPTELITGLFFEGGPLLERSVPVCKDLVGKSSAGTITVTNSVGTVLADHMALTAGQLLYVNVPAGSYTISGVINDGNAVGPITVVVAAGQIVRQDLVLDLP